MSFEKIAVIGLGYIGLPTAAMFASCKKRVIGV
ncbi:TPA: UDP-N-acetyl-D-mannosamine dehydrogenase, partial [Escherichia coli]|nr:UDP-N-acetyl-D-mannosamine dehydrogenase [Escherichia coli]